eukprot:Tbor_TRINITY_DN3131_c0_g1::TRINITY_DN3131_c0_g1_i1::g.14650::m.14650
MGGKKKSTAQVTKKESRYKIPRVFDCPRCHTKESIAIKIHKGRGEVSCKSKLCSRTRNLVNDDGQEGSMSRSKQKADFECSAGRLEEPVDVFFSFYESYRKQCELSGSNVIHKDTDLDPFRQQIVTQDPKDFNDGYEPELMIEEDDYQSEEEYSI